MCTKQRRGIDNLATKNPIQDRHTCLQGKVRSAVHIYYLWRSRVQHGYRSSPPQWKEIAVLTCSMLRKPQAMLLTFWIWLLSPSLIAWVTGCGS